MQREGIPPSRPLLPSKACAAWPALGGMQAQAPASSRRAPPQPPWLPACP